MILSAGSKEACAATAYYDRLTILTTSWANLEFDSPSETEAFRAALQRDVWGSRRAAPALMGSPQARIVEAVESKEY